MGLDYVYMDLGKVVGVVDISMAGEDVRVGWEMNIWL
jgi:hypothetical protein